MAEAKLNREYALRVLGVGAVMFGMCLWSLYDGNVAWPRQNRSMERVRAVLLATNLTAEAWVECGEEQGTSPLDKVFHAAGEKTPAKLVKKIGLLKIPDQGEERPAKREAQAKQVRKLLEGEVYSAHDLQTQTVQAVITSVVGLLAWLSLGLKARKRFYADATGLHGNGFGNGHIAFSDISKIDWSKWDEKGIVVLTLKSGTRHKLDGWHFAGMAEIVDEIKRQRADLNAAAKNA